MTFTALSVAILSTALWVFYKYISRGYKDGLSRSLVKFACLLFAAFFSVLISTAVSGLIAEPIMTELDKIEFFTELENTVAGSRQIVVILLKMLVSAIIFVPIFSVLQAIVSLVASILYKRFVKKQRGAFNDYLNEDEELYVKNSHRFGALVGAVSAFFVVVITFSPLIGMLKSTRSLVDMYVDISADESVNEIEEIQILTSLSDDAMCTVLDVCGAGLFFDLTARTQIYGQTTYLSKEIRVIENIDYEDIGNMLGNLSSPNDENIAELESFIDTISESVIVKSIAVSSISRASLSWLNRQPYMNVERPSFSDNVIVDEFLNELLYVLSGTTFDSFEADIHTLLNITKMFNEKTGVLGSSNYETIITELLEGGTATALREELDKNEHMRPIMYAVDDMIMSILVEELYNSRKFSTAARNALYTNFAEVLNETLGLDYSVRNDSVADNVQVLLDEYGIFLPEGLNQTLSPLMIQGITGIDGEITTENVQEFFEQYLGIQ